MKIAQKIKKTVHNLTRPTVSLDDKELLEWLGITPSSKKAVAEVTYYTCLKMLSETIGKMPLKYYQTTMWTTVEQNCQHYGNGYIWVRTQFTPSAYGGEYHFLDMWPMQSNCVTPIMDDIGIFGNKGKLYYQYNDPRSGQQYMFRNSEVLHAGPHDPEGHS